jgi:lipopolysaccharide assembly outer membrane protein LptD (OstA)
VYGEGFQSVNTDVSATIRDVTATAGTRFDHAAKIEFVTGQIEAKFTRNLNAHSSIHYDVQSGTPVEMRFGLDVLCQCASITLEYVRRQGVGLARNEDEVHFSVNLLGLGRVGTKAGLGAIR